MIARKEEQQLLHELALSGESEFVVVYGRRRVGKTFLVRETFVNDFFFTYTGIANVSAAQQRTEFTKALREHGWTPNDGGADVPQNWFDAFDASRTQLKSRKRWEYPVSTPMYLRGQAAGTGKAHRWTL